MPSHFPFSVLLFLAIVLAPACMAPPVSNTPESSGAQRSGNETSGAGASVVEVSPGEGEPAAILEGPMGTLDGKQLPHTERPTRVPVGCHVLTTSQGSVVVTSTVMVRYSVPPVTFALAFRPDHRYVIERTVMQSTGHTGTVRVQVHERDAQDALVQVHQPIKPEYAEVACARASR